MRWCNCAGRESKIGRLRESTAAVVEKNRPLKKKETLSALSQQHTRNQTALPRRI